MIAQTEIYEVIRVLETVVNFEKKDGEPGTLPREIRIEKFNGYSATTGVDIALRIKTAPTWGNSRIWTGLRPTKTKGVYYGDLMIPGHGPSLIIVHYDPGSEVMKVQTTPGKKPPTPQARAKLVKKLLAEVASSRA